ncbi:leucine-rich repeat domain-containing protein [Neobacillus sp. DY30]|uniref:leucine-rich repeat domain-containing protein n=1 Tax=Neobacillus sp. DY30 TaxID=3047871 RepID=UPI0024C07CE0|nr:leucine-rich repeat domain-containing protein [Neobacillus sp. DY30]WHY00229.1 leucine-rich repeat domain-containing protein [Neobacillus sp. DY30]
MRNRKWTNLSIVLVFLFSLFSPFASLETYAAAGLQLLDVTEKNESTVLVWEVVNEGEELTNYQLIKNGAVLDIEPVKLNESTEDNVTRYSYEDQHVEKNTLYKYEIAGYLSTGEKVVSAPIELTFTGHAAEAQSNVLADTEAEAAEAQSNVLVDTEAEAVTTNIKVVTDQGTIPWEFDFSINSDDGSEIGYYGYLDEDGFFVDYETESRDINLPIGNYHLVTYNYSTEEEVSAAFTIESGSDYVTSPIELVFPHEQLVIKKFIQVEGTTEQSISISWSESVDPEAVEKYHVYLNDELVEEITDPYNTVFTFSDLLAETSYQVKVEYVYKDGTSEYVTVEVMTSAPPAGEVVDFADENLKKAISNQLKIQHRDIYTDDMEKLTYLDASYSDISDLTGLEFAVNLTELMAYGNQIEDLSPLADLTNLTFLDLDGNLITSLDDLKKLQNLETLLLAFNQIEDIGILQELPKLAHVSLYGNEGLDFTKGSDDFEVLKNLISAGVSVEWMLESGEIFIKEVTESSIKLEFSFPGVADFISSYNLYLNGELVKEIPVEENSYKITGLDPLTEYEISVEAVDEDGNVWSSAYNYVMTPPVPAGEVIQFKDEALEEAVRDALYIYSRDLFESDLTILTSLDASGRGIEVLDGLELAVNLEALILDYNSVRNLTPIAGLTNLTHLSLGYNKLSDISGLASLANLQSLMLDGNEIADISILSQFSSLSILSLQGNKVKDIGALADLPIEFLNIGYNDIDDISSLLELENLQYVLIMNNPLDLTEGSETRSVIQTLKNNGVMVIYEYLDISVSEVTENSIKISWLPVPENDVQDYIYYVLVNGEEVAIDLTDSSYTLTNLEADTEYTIEILGISENSESFIYGTTVVRTAAVEENPIPGDTENPGEGTVGDGEDAPSAPDKETENGSTPDKQETENGTTPDKETQKSGSLPNTATNSFNLILLGLGLVAAGTTFFALKRRRVVKQ